MPQYMLLIHADPEKGPAQGSPEMEAQFARWGEYTQRLTEAGVMRSGAPLQAPATATTVAQRNGERLVTDGPFIETKEWLGGYYVIDVPDLDAAIDWAGQMPNISYGSVEVRPVMEIPGM